MKKYTRILLSIITAIMLVTAPVITARAESASAYITAINSMRAQYGVAPMTENTALNQAAVTRAAESAKVWSHTRPDGTPFYTVNDALCMGENLSNSYGTPAEVVAAWMTSPSHRFNLLDPGFTMVGVGTVVVNGINYTTAEFY